MKVAKDDLWKYADCEFVTHVGDTKIRVIYKTHNSKHVTVCNYYHRANTWNIKLQDFMRSYELVV